MIYFKNRRILKFTIKIKNGGDNSVFFKLVEMYFNFKAHL